MDEDELCPDCDGVLVATDDEREGDRACCTSCGAVVVTCGRCGSLVTEGNWREDVAMCEGCWQCTLDNN
jgi:hypothetical protein